MPALLIVPGLGGNEIWTPPSFFGLGDRIKIWLNYAGITVGIWRWLALAADGLTPTFPGVGSLDAMGPTEPYYSISYQWFSNRGYAVSFASNFWLGPIESDAISLAHQITGMYAQAPVNILAHSRGGLVTRRALQLLAAQGNLGLVGRVAGLGVPHQGSWEAASLIGGFQKSEVLLGILASLSPGNSYLNPVFGDLLQVIWTWPVVYQLLPMPGAVGIPPSATAAVYNAAEWAAQGVGASAAWLTEAQAYWSSLGPPPSTVDWVDVVGSGLSTADQLLTSGPPTSRASYSQTLAGDGVVPARWAVLPGNVSITTPTGHGSLVNDGRVLDALNGYYRNGLTQNVVIGGGLLP